jgi:hypothetical protein
MKAKVYKPGEKPVEVEAETKTYEDTGVEPCGDWLRKTIECEMFQLVPTPEGDLWCDEEGKLNGAPINEAATAEFAKYLFPGDYFVGTVIFFSRE